MPRWNNPKCGFQKGHLNYITDKIKLKISQKLTGRKLSLKHKENLSEKMKLDYNNGKRKPYWDGKIFTEEHKLKIKNKLIGKQFSIRHKDNISISAKKRGVPFGEKSPNWQNGISFEPYSTLFNQQLKDRIRVRDNFICQKCGVPELECDKRLAIHHIDYDKKNCEEDNLISLCNRCNCKVNGNRKHWKDFFQVKSGVQHS